MKSQQKKTIKYYLSLPYKIELIPDLNDGGFRVSIPDLPGCISVGETIDEAIANINDAKKAWIEAALEDGYTAADWGKTLVEKADEYYKYLFYDYDYVKAPLHYWPFTPNVLSNGGFTNGYGFKNE